MKSVQLTSLRKNHSYCKFVYTKQTSYSLTKGINKDEHLATPDYNAQYNDHFYYEMLHNFETDNLVKFSQSSPFLHC
jgi:hypothetical protein